MTHRASAGGADPHLDVDGVAQAHAVGRWLAQDPEGPIGAVYASPMKRAQETAEHIAAACGLPVRTIAGLAEFDLGATEYVPMELVGESIRSQVSKALQTGTWGAHRFDPDEFEARVLAGFDQVVAERAAERVVVVCHGGVINSYLSQVLERPRGVFVRPRYTSISRVLVCDTGDRYRIKTINETPHSGYLESGVNL